MKNVTLNDKPIDESFGTTVDHIRNIPLVDATTVKATGRHRRRKNSRTVVSYDPVIFAARIAAKRESAV
tara:strand:+ start:1387 stop:1593 length:207 start_codon:yes stop_codon:yes gene_type:complete